MFVVTSLSSQTLTLIHYSETYLALPEQHLVAVMFHCCSCGGGARTTRPPGYEPGELPLLYPAIYIKTENVFLII